MKKKDIINLIRCFVEGNKTGFRTTAIQIAHDFDQNGDTQLALYIMSLLSEANSFISQVQDSTTIGDQPQFFEKVTNYEEMLLLPDSIMNDVLGIVNAINYHMGLHRFLFEGAPGTGKTEAVKQLGRILKRDVYVINFSEIIDSKLGQTTKNIDCLFKQMNGFYQKQKAIFLFDEIDALALDRTNNHDVREMGRATSALLKSLDQLDKEVILVATTNLVTHFDKALLRRFDSVISFNRYTNEDLLTIAEKILNRYLDQAHLKKRDIRLFRKIMQLKKNLPYPGDLKNMIRTAIAFSNPNDEEDYFRRLYSEITGKRSNNLQQLRKDNFTVREMAILTGKSKSTIDRELKEARFDEQSA
ncbi:AAA family ATPase [Acidaminococcus massiliensis]|uniref:AAA family ATPase n=1 Tax=Acidaminococcus massiliensis TaxID=1852375 RepID=UPI0026DCC830|nr:AAA family ATPase [Acidaminococcus massiliensis]